MSLYIYDIPIHIQKIKSEFFVENSFNLFLFIHEGILSSSVFFEIFLSTTISYFFSFELSVVSPQNQELEEERDIVI